MNDTIKVRVFSKDHTSSHVIKWVNMPFGLFATLIAKSYMRRFRNDLQRRSNNV